MQTIIDEYDWWSPRSGTKEKNADATFFAGSNNWGGKAGRKSNREIECFNCHKKGHKKAECWAKGGGKEGQGLGMKLKKDKEELKKETAGAVVEEGVWMAIVNDSEDEHMADNEFDNFIILKKTCSFLMKKMKKMKFKNSPSVLKENSR